MIVEVRASCNSSNTSSYPYKLLTSSAVNHSLFTSCREGISEANVTILRSSTNALACLYSWYRVFISQSNNAAAPPMASYVAIARSRSPGVVRVGMMTKSDISRSEEHTSELQSRFDLVCRLLLEKKNKTR